MGYGKEITNYIVECWGQGLSAEETVKALEKRNNITIGLATVYRHRHSLTAKAIIDEIMRKQLRDIALAQNPSVRMKYRHKLLTILLPQIIEQKTEIDMKKEVKFESRALLFTQDPNYIKVMAIMREKQLLERAERDKAYAEKKAKEAKESSSKGDEKD